MVQASLVAMVEENNEADGLNKAQEVLWMVLVADEDPTLRLNPSKERSPQRAIVA
jgi:hypothetical protein